MKVTSFEKKYSSHIGYIYALICHFFFVIGGLLIKKQAKSLKTYQITYGMGIQIFCYNYVALKYNSIPICLKTCQTNKLMFSRGITGILGAALITLGFTLAPLSEAVAIQMTTPAISAILAIIFMNEKCDVLLVLNTIFSFVGVILITKPGFILSQEDSIYEYRALGLILVLIGAFIGGFIQILLKKLGSQTGPFNIALAFGGFLAVSSPLFQIIEGVNEVHFRDMVMMFTLGTTQAFGHFLLNKSYTFGNVGTISLMFYSQVLFAFFIDIVFEGIKPEFFSIVGSMSIFSCVFIMLYKNYMQKPAK